MGLVTLKSARQGDEFLVAQTVVDWLQDVFPGWEWTASLHEGALYIKNETLSARWGMQQRAVLVDKAWVIKAGGEILERFNMPYDFRSAALETGTRDFTGDFISEKWTPDRRNFKKDEQRWKA